jgi:hypothetical protein
MKNDIRFVGLVAAGVMVAGYVLNLLGDTPIITDARKGFRS